MELNKDLVLIKTEELRSLLNDYTKLDEAAKIRVDELRSRFLRDTSRVRISGLSNNEIITGGKEVEKLTKELENRISRRGLK